MKRAFAGLYCLIAFGAISCELPTEASDSEDGEASFATTHPEAPSTDVTTSAESHSSETSYDAVPGEEWAALTAVTALPDSGSVTQKLVLDLGQNEVILTSPSEGDWSVKSWLSFFAYDACGGSESAHPMVNVVLFTHWKDDSDPFGPWNYWPGGGPVCWPKFLNPSVHLYSGSSDISYNFRYENYGDYPVPLYIELTRQ